MSNKLIPFWILLVLSVFHFALAAPVAVGEILEVRSDAVDVLKDGIAAWEKRMDTDNEDRWSTNQAYRMPEGDDPGGDPDSDDAPGHYNEEDMLGSGSGSGSPWWYSEETESDARGPNRHYNDPPDFDPDIDLFYDSEDYLFDEGDGDGDGAKSGPNDGAKSDNSNDSVKSDDSNDGTKSGDSNDGAKSDGSDDGNGYDNGYDGDSDNSEDTVHSGQASADNTHLDLGPKSEHPATPEHITNLEKILNDSLGLISPRNWLRRCGYAKEGVAGNR